MTGADGQAPRWRRGPATGPAGTTAILDAADYGVARLRAMSIPFPESGRLGRAIAYVRAAHERGANQASDSILAEATRTIFETYWITRALGGGGRPDRDLTNSLARMLGGPDLPDDEDENSSRPRNTQFELFVGAWLAAGGVPVRHAEPDLVAVILNEGLGVAVKRIRSRSKIIRRMKEAAVQIEQRTKVGIVVVNVDALLDELPGTPDPEELGRQFDEAFPEYQQGVETLIDRPGIRGLMALGTRVGWARGVSPPRLDLGMFCKYRAFTDSAAEARAVDEFWEQFDRAQTDRLMRF